MTQAPRTSRAPAFTLLELIAVMVIIAVMLAAVVPSLRHFGKGRQTADAAAQMMMLIRQGRSTAINEARAHRFNIDPQARQYFLTVQQDGAYVPLSTSWGRKFNLPAQMRVEWDGRTLEQPQFIDLAPTGAIDDARILLRIPGGGTHQIVCRAGAQSVTLSGESEALP